MSVIYKFGEFRLDCGRYELMRGDRPLKLERKPLDLLVLFTSNPGQLVTRAQIADKLWTSDVFVDTEHGINTAIRKLRLLLRDDPAKPKFIQTVTGLGYRFVAPVMQEARMQPAAEAVLVVPQPPAIVAATSPSKSTPRLGLSLWWIAVAVGICGLAFLLSKPKQVALKKISPEAHDAYLRGKYLWFGRDMEESGDWFRKATQLQPDYAAAWAGLSDYYGEGVAGGVLDPRNSLRPMEEAANRALALDPNSAESHLAIAATYLIGKWDWANADRESQEAIRLDPKNAESYYLRSCVLAAMRRDTEAIEAAKRSMELAPLQRPGALAGQLMEVRRYDEALDDLRLRRLAQPTDPDLLFLTADTWRRKGNYEQAADFLEKWLNELGDHASAERLRRAWKRGGKAGFARESLTGLQQWAKNHYSPPAYEAQYHAELGEKEATLDLLEEAYRQHSTGAMWMEDDPEFDFLHAEPRYQALVKAIGRPQGELAEVVDHVSPSGGQGPKGPGTRNQPTP